MYKIDLVGAFRIGVVVEVWLIRGQLPYRRLSWREVLAVVCELDESSCDLW